MAPCHANIFIVELEENFLANYLCKPLAYYRYIDDIFIIWSHGLDLLHNFINDIKKQRSSIIFTSNISTTSFKFLDVAIDLDGDRISTKTYAKSQTHTHFFHTAVSKRDIYNNLFPSISMLQTHVVYDDNFLLG